ncbi:MAG TPA: hypothetical protein VFX12_16080 [Vicinamibacterales bacterium]|nr:hypothetical protein [Vicinamibacterales bacterium]
MDWQAMVWLGAYHGINPGMGWLFAVALGMQHGSARGVWRALPPIALGHALAVAAVVTIAGLAGLVLPAAVQKAVVAAMLLVLGLYRLRRHRHPRVGGMQVGFRDLTAWSFLMASAHGAGLMVLPFVMSLPTGLSAAAPEHAHHMAFAHDMPAAGAMAVAVHTLTYLTVMASAAWVVYARVGLTFLRRAWLNMDWVWAGALVLTGLIVLLK